MGYGDRREGGWGDKAPKPNTDEKVKPLRPEQALAYEAAVKATQGCPPAVMRYIVLFEGGVYMQINGRLIWFKHAKPNWVIVTEVLHADQAYGLVKAEIRDEAGRVMATGHATGLPHATRRHGKTHVEKAETMAIGRALALAGFGLVHLGLDQEGDFALDGEDLDVAPVRTEQALGRRGRQSAPKAAPAPNAPPPWAAKLNQAIRDAGAPTFDAGKAWVTGLCVAGKIPLPEDMNDAQRNWLFSHIQREAKANRTPWAKAEKA